MQEENEKEKAKKCSKDETTERIKITSGPQRGFNTIFRNYYYSGDILHFILGILILCNYYYSFLPIRFVKYDPYYNFFRLHFSTGRQVNSMGQ